ncbi:alpha-D-ribose 1-methylphosphonate 5-triphosphate diphosphatase [Saxibacter everestensis]|uniref:Alpha-D-ribose 1-methylphosphonate 5-triphosphate diphosphatase n=1 Tax=Saxibacter everestensis TaxID=2909229 RepID=A0ABY8QY64_9MICO|nr:alpha-D-ribose 1-methylphosphonate 5-triphosphate diphosphatase [Brevibacteriaceae bacterium ZFBP1038]
MTGDKLLDNYVLGHVRAVVRDRIVDDATVVVRDGSIAEVRGGGGGSRVDVDGRGALCLPGLVDIHSDNLSREHCPRPGATLPADFALASVESQLRAAGIATGFHGVAFQQLSAVGLLIDQDGPGRISAAISQRQSASVDHRILHRVDIRSPAGIAALRAALDDMPSCPAANRPVVSHEDHTPGQGQYADPAVMQRWLVETGAMGMAESVAHVSTLAAARDEFLGFRDEALDWLGGLARAGKIILAGHDPASESDIDLLARRGGTIAEFPTTTVAGRAARCRGLASVVGAPNIVRGGSHAGNVSALALIAAGAANVIASDYLPTAMLAGAFEVARQGAASLPNAVAMVTANPATATGLRDRGALIEGLRADLILIDDSGRWPKVMAPPGTGYLRIKI